MNEKERLELGIRVSTLSIWVNILLTLAKLFAGVVARSSAMVADAVHSGSDILASFSVLVGLKLASKPADAEHPYGHARLESIAAKIVASLLIITAIGLMYSSGNLLLSGEASAPGSLAIYAGLLSIIVKELLYRYTVSAGQRMQSTAVIAEAWHHRSDAYSSIGALIGIVGARLAFPWLDPLAGLVVAAIVLKVGLQLYLQAINDLIDSAPAPEVVSQLLSTTLGQRGVLSVQELRARRQGHHVRVDLEICVNPQASLVESHTIAHQVEERIKDENPNVTSVMVHVNPCQVMVSGCQTCGDGK